MAILEQLLKKQLLQSAPASDDLLDIQETARPYRRWALGFRSLIRLRYLALKKRVLLDNRRQLKYDVSSGELKESVLDRLRMMRKGAAWWSIVLSPLVVYTLTVLALAGLLYFAYLYNNAAVERSIFKNDIPRFGDTVYRLKAAQIGNAPNQVLISTLVDEISDLKQRVLEHFTEHPEIQGRIQMLLEGVESKDIPPQELIALSKKVNDALFEGEIPYYLSTLTEAVDCAYLPLEVFMQRLFGGIEKSGEVCWVYALLSFHVDEFRFYTDNQANHLAYFTRRLDELGITEIVLGRVHIGDNTAQVLLSNIEGSSNTTLTAVNDGILQTKLMPRGMPDVYGLESLARRLQSRVIESYVSEFESSLTYRFRRVWNKLTGHETSLLLAAAQKLDRRTADVTAFHEVQHLVDQYNDIQEPQWFERTLQPFGDRLTGNPDFRNHVLWELSAFFTHLAYGGELKGILLNDFTAITLDPMLQDQPHFYSVRILLPILHEMLEGKLHAPPPVPAATLGDVARSYKALATNADQLDTLARDAYKILFDRDIPELREIALKTRKIK